MRLLKGTTPRNKKERCYLPHFSSAGGGRLRSKRTLLPVDLRNCTKSMVFAPETTLIKVDGSENKNVRSSL